MLFLILCRKTWFSSVQSVTQSCLTLCDLPWTVAHQASLSTTNSQSLLKLMCIESVMASNHLVLCRPLLLKNLCQHQVFSSESVLHIRWPKYWSLGFSISPSNEYSGRGSFKIDLGLISLLSKGLPRVFSHTTVQKHQFFGAQLCLWSNSKHPYMTTEKP